MTGPFVKTIAVGLGGVLLGSALLDYGRSVIKDPWAKEPEGFAVLMSTTSSAAVLVQDTVSGDPIEIPPVPAPVLKSSA